MANTQRPGMVAGLFVLATPFLVGGTTSGLTAYADCRDHGSDSCIPFHEIVFGAVMLGVTFGWISWRLARGRDWVQTFAAVYVTLGVWMLMMLPVMWTACQRDVLGDECLIGLRWGVALVPISMLIASRGLWRPGRADSRR